MSADANNLALIYSRLAALESRESTSDILETITQKHSLHYVGAAELSAIEEAFNRACSDPIMVDAIKSLFDQEHRIKDEVARSLPAKAKQYHTQKLNSDQMVSDTFRFGEVLKTLRPQVQDMSELCRSLQALDKEKGDHHAKMLQAERDKTATIARECGASLSSVTTKIDAEEADIDNKAAENEELRAKLEQFRGHLELRREKQRNEERTRELVLKLEAAKLAQTTYLDEQERMKRDSCKSKIVHASETILQLESQLGMYDQKFQEFESTLARTNDIMLQLHDRETSLLSVVERLRVDHAEWKARSQQADVSLVTVLDDKQKAEEELSELKAAAQKAEARCRKLQARRKELLSQTQNQQGQNSKLSGGVSAGPEQAPSQQTVRLPSNVVAGSSVKPTEEGLVGEGSPVSSP